MGMKVNGTTGLTFPDTTTLASAGQASVRAWVNFNGTGTVAIRASYNVTSITDGGTGLYTANFTTAMPDVNYAAVGSAGNALGGFSQGVASFVAFTTSGVQLYTEFGNSGPQDSTFTSVAIFR